MYTKKLFAELARIRSILVFTLILSTTTAAHAASVTLRWNPNHPAPEGYRVFSRKNSQAYDYSRPDWDGTALTCTIDNLDNYTTYYFVVKAYKGRLESADSEEVHYTPSAGSNPLPAADVDDDGMPDDWEIIHGLDPTVDEANDDLDGDGIDNRDEFRANLEPEDPGVGMAPARPLLVSPIAYTQVAFNPTLTVSTYEDPDGDAHIATQWQLFNADTGECMLDVISDRRLIRLKVPLLLLNCGMTYTWRLRFFDSGGRVSEWSDNGYFTTEEATHDLDGNSIPDNQEGGDVWSGGVHAINSAAAELEPTGIMVFSDNTPTEIEQVKVVDPADFETDGTAFFQRPSAMVAYKVLLDEPGQWAHVSVQLSTAAPSGAKWVRYDTINGWVDCSDGMVFSADRQMVTMTIKDGGYGDTDGVANGIIVDPSGLALLTDVSPDAGTGGGGGGCFITTVRSIGRI